mgnify:CR=1 FL=1
MDKLQSDDQYLFENFARMSLEDFNYLVDKVSSKIMKCDTNYRAAIPPKTKLLLTLRFLTTGGSYKSLLYLFRIYELTISKTLQDVCQAIIEVLEDHVQMRYIIRIM